MESSGKKIRPGWLPLLAAAFAAGIWFGARCAPTSTAPAAWFFPLAAGAVVAARRGHRALAAWALAGAFFGAGWDRGASLPQPPPACLDCGEGPGGPNAGQGPGAGPPFEPDRPCTERLAAHGLEPPGPKEPAHLDIEGLVREPPTFHQGQGQVAVAVTRARATRASPHASDATWVDTSDFSIWLSLPGGLRPLPGDRILLSAALDDPGVDLPGRREKRDRLIRRGISCLAKVERGRMVVTADANGVSALVESTRRRLLSRLSEKMEKSPAAALVLALAVGDREAIEPEQRQRFAASGLAHVLSVSGLHLGITVLGFYRLLEWILARLSTGRWDPKRLAALLSLPVVPAYAALTGGSPPVLRAAIGTGLFLLATCLYRAPDGWSALGAAALILLAWSPTLLLEPSFQLSFAACLGLLAIAPSLRAALLLPLPPQGASRARRWLELPLAAFITSAAATLATLPLLAVHFGEVSLAALPANVVSGPVAMAATVAAAVCAAVGLVAPSLLPPVLSLARALCGLLDGLAGWFASLPLASIPWVAPSSLEIGLLVALSCLTALAGTRGRLAAAGSLIVCVALVWLRLPPGPDGRLHVEFLPVGQGDCTLLRLPDGQAILVDTGGEVRDVVDVATTRVLPQLRARGIRSLAALAISHLHPDHVGAAPGILDRMPVGEVWTTGRPLEGRFGKPLAEAIERTGVPRRILARGQPPIEIGGVTIEILGPPDIDGLSDDPLLGANDGSLVLRIVHGEVAILLTGDVEEEGEALLVESERSLRANLLKAPHHGSRTSSSPAFLDKVRPEHVVFCVGHRNQFGFPHPEVVDRYRQAGCQLHRTDRGPIHFVSDGVHIERPAP